MKNPIYLSVIAAAFTLSANAQLKKPLLPVFTPQTQFELKTTLVQDYYESKKLKVHQLSTYRYLLTVLSKDTAGTTAIRATYKGIHFITDDRNDRTITGFNSDQPDSMVDKSANEDVKATNDLYKQFNHALLDQSFTIYFNRKGIIEKVTGVDAAKDYALTRVTGRTEGYLQGFRAGMKTQDENEEVKATLQKAFDYITPRPAGIGESWVKVCATELGDIKVNYTLKAAGEASLHISAAANILDPKNKMTVSRKDSFTVDAQSGLLRNAVIREDVVSTATNPSQIRMNTSGDYTLLVK